MGGFVRGSGGLLVLATLEAERKRKGKKHALLGQTQLEGPALRSQLTVTLTF